MTHSSWERASEFFSIFRVVVWIVVIPLSWIFGWISSIAFVALCSLYANLASDYAAWRADRNPKIEQKLDKILEYLEKRTDHRQS